LKFWVGRTWIKGLISASFDCVKECAETFLFGKVRLGEELLDDDNSNGDESSTTPVIKTPNIKEPQFYFQTQFFQPDSEKVDSEVQKEIFRKEIAVEVENFRKLLMRNNSKIINETTSSKEFWIKNKKTFPKICELALILLNINSSSAFIERFFSICGFIQDKRRQNITIDLFKMRCLLRANIKILDELKGTSFE